MTDLKTKTWQALKKYVMDIDPEQVLDDARAAGLSVQTIEDFRRQAPNYWRIEDLAGEYVARTARWCAAGGATTGIGGPTTALTLGAGDLAHMAARLYWLCQRLAVLHGFDPRNARHRDAAEQVYLSALGFDTTAQASLREHLHRAAAVAGKRGAYDNYMLRLVVAIAERLGGRLASRVAARFIPVVGAVSGATVNYTFAKQAGQKMQAAFKGEYFKAWQAGGWQA
jgi:EcsC protein family